MGRINRFLLLALGLLLVLYSLGGCATNKAITKDEMAVESREAAGVMPASGTDSISEESSLEPEKVITNIYLSFETTDFDKTNQELNKLIAKYDSYIENSNISYNRHYNNKSYRHANFVIRVPKDKVEGFKSELKGIGNLISESTNKEDVTKEYRDTESRLNVLTIKEERILALLEKAERIEDIIELENQLNEVIYEKEKLKSSLMDIDDKVEFSTIHMDIREVERLRNAETIESTFTSKVKNAISDSFYGFTKSIENFIIWFIYALPYIIVIGIVGYGIYRVAKYIISRRKDKS